MAWTASDQTLLEMQDTRVRVATAFGLAASILLVFLTCGLAWKLKSRFFGSLAVLVGLPMLFIDISYLLALDRIVTTNWRLAFSAIGSTFALTQLSFLSAFRFRVIARIGHIDWYTKRVALALMCFLQLQCAATILVLGLSYYFQLQNQPYFTSHPWRVPAVASNVLTTIALDLYLNYLTLKVVWSIRMGALLGPDQVSATSQGGTARRNYATVALASLTRIKKSTSISSPLDTERSSTATSSDPPPMQQQPQQVISQAKGNRLKWQIFRTGLVAATLLTMLLLGLGGLAAFTISNGMLSGTVSGSITRVYANLAVVQWILMMKIAKS
ncbi:hypothetical protein BC828DRAFT_379255 [Blastocladiella britannica]|nr:hypothetical protein BC828DRAFT_379255 [Blastocladiella britannica]